MRKMNKCKSLISIISAIILLLETSTPVFGDIYSVNDNITGNTLFKSKVVSAFDDIEEGEVIEEEGKDPSDESSDFDLEINEDITKTEVANEKANSYDEVSSDIIEDDIYINGSTIQNNQDELNYADETVATYLANSNNYQNVQNKLRTICDPLIGTEYDYDYYVNGAWKAGGCQAFALSIYEKLFGYSRFGNPSKTYKRSDQTDWNNIGNYLKNNARPGDVLRAYSSIDTNAHSVILYSIDSKSITYYESEGKRNSNKVKKTTETYDDFTSIYHVNRSCPGYFIYQIYDDVYQSVGSGSIPPTPTPGKDMGPESPWDPEIEDDDYIIMSALRYDLHLNIEGDDKSDDDDNVNVERGFYEDTKYDVFKVRLLDNGYYKLIQNKTNHMAVSVAGKSTSEDANIQMYYWNPEDLVNNTEFQWAIQWAKKQDGIPYHYLRPRCSGLYMTAAGTTNGKNVYQAEYDDDDDDCQKWFFARYMKPDIETNSLPNGTVGKSYKAGLEADSDFVVKWTFSSKDDSLPPGLSLDEKGKITGTPTKAGTYSFSLDAENILVDALGLSSKKYTITIAEAAPILVQEVKLDKSTLDLKVGNTGKLQATVLQSNATNKKLEWTSNDKNVATVNESGVITAVKAGKATITVRSTDGSNKSASCLVTVTDSSSGGIVIKGGEVIGVAGNSVSVPVSISGNTGIGGMALTITYDPALELKAIEKGNLLVTGTFNADAQTGFVQWYTSGDAVKSNGILFTLKFDVKEGTSNGNYPVNITYKDGLKANITDENSVTLDVDLKPGSVNIQKRKKGDVTGNGEVAMGDVIKTARAVSGSVTLTDEEKAAADVTGDGDVAMGDVVKMARFVAGSIKSL